MMKKLSTLFLCSVLFVSSLIGISAVDEPFTTPIQTTTSQTTRSTSPVIASKFTTMNPGVSDSLFVSASGSTHSYRAQLLSNGNIQLLIDQKALSTRCYYQHLATDETGTNFTPDKDVYFYLEDDFSNPNNVYSVEFDKGAVSKDGYLYLKFAIEPVWSELQYLVTYYKIPIDYESNKFESTSFQLANPDTQLSYSASAAFATYDVRANLLANGDAELLLHFNATNANFWLENLATDGNIKFPNKAIWYQLHAGLEDDHNTWYRMVIPKDCIIDGHLYINTYFLLPSPFNYYPVHQLKVPVQMT